VFVNTEKNVLFSVAPSTRLPRTFKRFCGLMGACRPKGRFSRRSPALAVQLLQKLSIRASNGPQKLMRVVKQPVSSHLPTSARRVGLSHSAASVHAMSAYVASLPPDVPVVFVVGAMAHGRVSVSYTDEFISISEFPLSAACCLGRICNALETKHGIV
jgi:rRNA small subunit pseudouridine methyltransferase Nep1